MGVLPSLPGFLAATNAIRKDSISPIFLSIYNYAWFVGFTVAFVSYLIARKLAPAPIANVSVSASA
jgi:NCS1 family nucleobase:cation symporter-1